MEIVQISMDRNNMRKFYAIGEYWLHVSSIFVRDALINYYEKEKSATTFKQKQISRNHTDYETICFVLSFQLFCVRAPLQVGSCDISTKVFCGFLRIPLWITWNLGNFSRNSLRNFFRFGFFPKMSTPGGIQKFSLRISSKIQGQNVERKKLVCSRQIKLCILYSCDFIFLFNVF